MRSGNIAVFGTISLDLTFNIYSLPNIDTQSIFANEYNESHGGAAANVCAYLAGTTLIDTLLISAIGNDETGNNLIKYINQCGVNTSGVMVYSSCSSSRICTLIEPSGKRMHIVFPGAIEKLNINDIQTDILDKYSYLYIAPNKRSDISNYLAQYCKTKGICTIFNPGPAYMMDDTRIKEAYDIFKNIDILILNEYESRCYSGKIEFSEISNKLLNAGPSMLVITTDKKGAKVFTTANEYVHKGFQVEEINSIGAGDAFSAGFIGMLAKGKNVEYALTFANGLGAWKVQNSGTRDCIPSINDITKFMQIHSKK